MYAWVFFYRNGKLVASDYICNFKFDKNRASFDVREYDKIEVVFSSETNSGDGSECEPMEVSQ